MTSILLVDPSARGGIAAYTSQLAAALTEAGAPPVLLASRGLPPRPDPAGVRVLRRLPDHVWGRPEGAAAPFYARRLREVATSSAALLRTVREVRPDVVHLQFGLNPRVDATLVRAVRRTCPVVWTAHDVEPLDGALDERLLAALRTSDAVLVHTEPARQLLLGHGIAAQVVEHVPAAVPGSARVPRAQARARLGLPPDGRLLAALGFVRPYKGYDLLADVWEALGDAAPRLLVLGAAWSEADERVLDRLEATGRADVRRGYADDADLALAAAAADALLLPHARASDSGLLHLARAVGTPVLASDAPQLAASVEATRAGRVLVRHPAVWSEAVLAQLPPAPAAPPELEATGRRHLEVYDEVRRGADDRRLKLVAVTDAQELGGAERVLHQVVTGLSSRYAVTVLGNNAAVLASVCGDSAVAGSLLLPPVADKTDLRPILAHVRALRALHPDVVVINLRTPWAAQYATLAAVAARPAALVAIEHAPVPATARFQVLAKRWTARRLSAHIAVTAPAARRVELLAGLPRDTVRVVRNGTTKRPTTAVELPPGLRRPVIVAAGRLDRHKGFDLLLHAMAELPEVSLWLLGEGAEREALVALAERLEVTARVRFEGWHVDPPAAFAAADVVVISSREDALPLTAFEALHAGAPLVATRVGALPDEVGDAAVLVEPESPAELARGVRAVLADPALAAALRRRGAERAAAAPTVGDMVEAYAAVLSEVLPASRRG